MTQPKDKMRAEIIEAVRAAWHSVGIQDDGWDWADFALEIQWNIDNPKCGQCDGSGERQYLSDNSPDAYEVTGECGRCNGNGTTKKQAACAQQSAKASQDALDAARIDWLESSKESHGFCHSGYGDYQYYAHQMPGSPTVREAIDAAISAQGASNA